MSNQPNNWTPLPDTSFFDSKDMHELLPLEVDDNYIFESDIRTAPHSEPSLVRGFLAVLRVFLCFTTTHEEPNSDRLWNSSVSRAPFQVSHGCDYCVRCSGIGEISVFERLLERTQSLAKSLEGQTLFCRTTPSAKFNKQALATCQNSAAVTKEDQFGIMGANVYITNLWAQYTIIERITLAHQHAACESPSFTPSPPHMQHLLAFPSPDLDKERSTLCDKALSFLSDTRLSYLEGNGTSLTFKVRQIATLLLNNASYEKEAQASVATHGFSETYQASVNMSRLLKLLSDLDTYSLQDTQQVIWNQLYRGQ